MASKSDHSPRPRDDAASDEIARIRTGEGLRNCSSFASSTPPLPTPRTRVTGTHSYPGGGFVSSASKCNPICQEMGVNECLDETENQNPAWQFMTTYTFWLFYLLIIVFGKWIVPTIANAVGDILLRFWGIDNIFGIPWLDIRPEWEWSAVCLIHLVLTFLTFHWNKGTGMGMCSPGNGVGMAGLFRDYDELTFWEQLEDGKQYTATRKFFTLVPLFMCLAACWEADWAPRPIWFNVFVLAFTLIPKLPVMHGIRLLGMNLSSPGKKTR